MNRQVIRLLTIATISFVSFALTASDGGAQTGDFGDVGADLGGIPSSDVGNTGGGDLGGDLGTGAANTGANLGNDLGADSGGGGASAGQLPNLGDLINMNLDAEIPVIEDERRRGFVGPTSELGAAVSDVVPPTGFVGATSEAFGAGATGGTTSRTGGRTGAQAQGQQGTGQQNGFVVTRQNLRTRVRPAFQVTSINGDFVSTRFQSRMQRQPATSSFGRNVQVDVQNRTAVVSGTVQSADEADRIIRQLRLEPGVYRIDNRLTVGN